MMDMVFGSPRGWEAFSCTVFRNYKRAEEVLIDHPLNGRPNCLFSSSKERMSPHATFCKFLWSNADIIIKIFSVVGYCWLNRLAPASQLTAIQCCVIWWCRQLTWEVSIHGLTRYEFYVVRQFGACIPWGNSYWLLWDRPCNSTVPRNALVLLL